MLTRFKREDKIMLSTERLVQIESELMALQHELQQYIIVDSSAQSVTNELQNRTVSHINKARSELKYLTYNLSNYPKVS